MDNTAKAEALADIWDNCFSESETAGFIKVCLDLRDTVDYRACPVHGKDYLAGCTNCDRNAAIDAFDKATNGETNGA